MNVQFNKAFTIHFFHTYFKDGRANDMSLSSAQSSSKNLESCKIQQVNKGSHQEFFTSAASLAEDLKNLINNQSVDFFEFDIICGDPYFFARTKGPLEGAHQFELSNKKTIKNENTQGLILDEQLIAHQDGIAVGWIRLYLKELIAQLDSSPTQFEAHFEARKTQLSYYIIGAKPDEKYAIISENGVIFSFGGQVDIQNGQKALFFYTEPEAISFEEVPSHKFSLVKNNIPNGEGNGQDEIITNLPLPRPEVIQKKEVDGQQVVTAPMYIYI